MTRIFIFAMPRILNNQRRLSNALCINYLRLAAGKRGRRNTRAVLQTVSRIR
jgi:hypothetical protein